MADTINIRSYFLTGNNPEQLIEELEIDHKTAKEQDYRASLETLVDIWVRGDKKHKPRSPELNGVMAIWERGETGTHHVHLWICSKNAISIEQVKKRFPRFHIDLVNASNVADVESYIYKTGKHEGKGEQLCKPVKWGEYFCTNKSAAKRLYQDLEEYVKEGMTPSQIILFDPRFAMHEQMVQSYFGAYRQSRIKPLREVKTIYHTGEVGAGKSYTYVQLCNEHGEENVYLFNGTTSTHGGFDEYEGEPYLVLDEIRADTFRLPELLTLLDGYKRRLPARYKNKYAAWEEVHITTVIPPEKLFEGMKKGGKMDTFEQLQRRLNVVVYHYKDARFSGDKVYKTVEARASEYKSVDLLRQKAEMAKKQLVGQGTIEEVRNNDDK